MQPVPPPVAKPVPPPVSRALPPQRDEAKPPQSPTAQPPVATQPPQAAVRQPPRVAKSLPPARPRPRSTREEAKRPQAGAVTPRLVARQSPLAARPAPPKAAPPKAEPPKPKPRVRPTPIRPKNFLWAFPPEPPFEDQALPAKNAPAVDAQGRFLVFTQGRLSALVEEEGKPRVVWDYVVGSHVPGRIVLGPDGNVRLHSGDGLLHCVSPEGKQVFSPAQVGEPLGFAAPVVDRDGNTYVSSYHGGLVRVGPDGKPSPRRYLRSRRKFDSAAILVGSVLYVGCEDPYLFAVELGGDRASLLWNLAAEQGLTGGFVNSSPALTADGIVVVAARDENLLGFLPSGGVAFSTKIPGQMLGSPVIDRHGHIYVGV